MDILADIEQKGNRYYKLWMKCKNELQETKQELEIYREGWQELSKKLAQANNVINKLKNQ